MKGAAVENAPERPTASVAEVAALAEAMPEHLRVTVLLAAWCQLRRGELLGLRRRDVDLLHGSVSVAVTRTKLMSGEMIDKAPKSDAGRRTVAVPSHVLPALHDSSARSSLPRTGVARAHWREGVDRCDRRRSLPLGTPQ